MTTQLAKKPMDSLKSILKADSVMEQFRNCLGNHADSFVASVIDCVNTDSALLECNPGQLVQECLKAATLKLPLNKGLGYAYVIAFNNTKKTPEGAFIKVKEPTFQIGYKGYIQLALRTGRYKNINADVVYEGEYVGKNKLTGEININGEKKSDKVVGYFAYFEFTDGFAKSAYMTVEEMAQHALQFSKTFAQKDGKWGVYKNRSFQEVTIEQLVNLANSKTSEKAVGWMGNFNAMAIKTMLRNLLGKYGYLSVEDQNVVSREIQGDTKLADDTEETTIEAEYVDESTGELVRVIDVQATETIQAEKAEEAVKVADKASNGTNLFDKVQL